MSGGNTLNLSSVTSSQTSPSSSVFQMSSPILTEIKDMFTMMKQHTDSTAQMLTNELNRVQKEQMSLSSKVNALSPMHPRSINFSEGGSSHLPGDFIAMESTPQTDLTTTSAEKTTPLTSYLYGMPPWTPSEMTPSNNDFGSPQQGATFMNNTIVTPNADNFDPFGNFHLRNDYNNAFIPSNNPFAGNLLEKRFQDLEKLLKNIPGVTPPIRQVSPTFYNRSRFAPHIADVDIPKKFYDPSMKMYDGSSDPEEHVAHY